MPYLTSSQPGTWTLFGFRFPALRRWNLGEKETISLIAVLLLVLIVYLRCLNNGFVYDDNSEIVFNHQIGTWAFVWKSTIHDIWWFRDPKHLPQSSYYRPVQNLSLAIGYQIAGISPLRWHILKLLLHLSAVLLSFRFYQLLSGSVATSLLASLLFGVLAVHAEPVIWATAIPEPLSAIFEVAAFCSFVRWSRWRVSGLVPSLILFALATMTHESAVVFPFLIAAYIFLLDPHVDQNTKCDTQPSWGRRSAKAAVLAAPFMGVDLLYLCARLYAMGKDTIFGASHQRVTFDLIGSKIFVHHFVTNPPPLAILNTLPVVIATYLELTMLPWFVGPAHPVQFVTSRSMQNFYRPLALLAFLLIGGYTALRKNARAKLYLFCTIWWFVTLSPALSLNQIVALVQDRFEYVPSIGFCMLLACLSVALAKKGAHSRGAIALGLFGTIAVQVVTLWRVQPIWRDGVAMFGKCVEIYPDSAHYRTELAYTLESRGDLEGAVRQLAVAAENEPTNYYILFHLSQLYARMGREAEAQREFRAYVAAFAPWSEGRGVEKPSIRAR